MLHEPFEKLAALRVIAKLVEARTRRREQNDVARPRLRRRLPHRRLKIVNDHGLGERAQSTGDDLLGRAEEHQVANFLFDFLFKGAVIAAFIDAAGKQDHRTGKARQRFHDRADISSLRVVVIAYAVVLAHELEPVLETGKIIQGLLNPRARDAGAFRRGDGRHHVFDIVHAVNLHGAEHEAFFDARYRAKRFRRPWQKRLAPLR